MNFVILIGRLTKDPELSYTPNLNTAVVRFNLAVDRPRKNGEDAGADFFRITAFGKIAENCDRYLDKGRQVCVSGRIETGDYTNRDGVKVYTTDIIASNVEFLAGGQNSRSGGGSNNRNNNYNNSDKRSAQDDFDNMPQGFGSIEDVPWG